jgi:hypothetical protein
MIVSVLEAGFRWRVRYFRVLQHATKHLVYIGVVGAGEISKPLAVSLTVAAMSIPQI